MDGSNLASQLAFLLEKSGKAKTDVATHFGLSDATINPWFKKGEGCNEAILARLVDFLMPAASVTEKCTKLRLLLDALQLRHIESENQHWTPESRKLALQAMENLPSVRVEKTHGRTLMDFPGAFYPLAVVTGDKRDDSETRISIGDFGVVSASPAEGRWLYWLGLDKSVELFGDKVFVLETVEQLRARFGNRNLLVIGSPGSNHLARRLLLSKPPPGWKRGVPIFRFNLEQDVINDIESLLGRLDGKTRKELIGKKGDPKTDDALKNWLQDLFTGGIIDPSYYNDEDKETGHLWLRGRTLLPARDFGLITFARNPFSAEGDDRFVCILAAGFHMFGTAHAIRTLANPERFRRHQFGGVIRVDMDLDDKFQRRFDRSASDWDNQNKSEYDFATLKNGFKLLLERTPNRVNISKEEIHETDRFLDAL